jgi:hypothetical protein
MRASDATASEVAGFEVALWMLPIIYIILTLLRFVLVAAFRPLYLAAGGDIGVRETVFITMAGLRGSASLIMGQAVVVETGDDHQVRGGSRGRGEGGGEGRSVILVPGDMGKRTRGGRGMTVKGGGGREGGGWVCVK